MLRLIDRYIIKEILPYFLLSLFLLTAIIFVHEANRFSELFVIFSRRGLNSWPLVRLTLSLLPSIFVFTIPIALLLGILMGLGRLASDSELIVLRASGLGRWRLLLPILMLAIFTALLTGYNTAYLLPEAIRSLNSLKNTRSELILRGVADQVKPGIFEESVPKKVIFIRDVDRNNGIWRQVFVADETDPESEPRILIAQEGELQIGKSLEASELQLYNGFVYESYLRKRREQDKATTYSFQQTALRLSLNRSDDSKSDGKSNESSIDELAQLQLGPEARTLPELLQLPLPAAGRERTLLLVERQKRIALPVACLVFALIGVALGMIVSRGGRSSGLVIGIGVTLSYYLLFIVGEDLARQQVVPAFLGVWLSNFVLAGFGLLMLLFYQKVRDVMVALGERLLPMRNLLEQSFTTDGRRVVANRVTFGFPRLIDRMILGEMARYFVLVLLGITAVFLVFTLFELTNSIVENNIPAGTVANYLFFLVPQILQYVAPFAILVAVLVTFGLFGRTSQLIALNASGQSLYRVALPALLYSLIVGSMMFACQEYVMPFANRQQDYLRYLIKGGKLPPQTFYQANRKWFLGQENRLIHIQYFDQEKNKIAGLAIYEMDTENASLLRRIYANEANWDANAQEWLLRGGFVREFDGTTIKTAEKFKTLRIKLPERPEFFKQQVPESSKMSIAELQQQIEQLQASGIDVLNLRIALQTKLANPLTCLVMALMGIPFAFGIGKRGALAGVGVSLFIAIAFWGSLELFSQLGRYELLPPLLSAWGSNLLFAASGIYMFFTAKT
jgi:LPS export ABC transporter permease LptG/LPS export ABC transporter permease LptF